MGGRGGRNKEHSGKPEEAPGTPLARPRPFVLLRAGAPAPVTLRAVWGLPCPAGRGGGGQAEGKGGLHTAEQPRLSQKMRSDVVLRKQLDFLQRLQKPTPCLPRHICAAEGRAAGNRGFPEVTGSTPAVFSRRHQGVGSGRAGWEVMQLRTKASGSLQREVRWAPWARSWLNFHLHLTMESSSPKSRS